jgi:ribonuclease VapC
MFIDSSVVVEILIDGDKANELLGRMAESRSICTRPTMIYESAIVLSTRLGRHPGDTKLLVQSFLERFGISVLPASYEVASAAIDAFARYGKGRHAAKLNFGDCFSYAGARHSGLPLLYVGGDFARTDIA